MHPPRLREPCIMREERHHVPPSWSRLPGKFLQIPSRQRPQPAPRMPQRPRASILDPIHRRIARQHGSCQRQDQRRIGQARRQRLAPTSLTLRVHVCAARSAGHATYLQLFTLPRGIPGEAITQARRPAHSQLGASHRRQNHTASATNPGTHARRKFSPRRSWGFSFYQVPDNLP
jgi:hypothetical protein